MSTATQPLPECITRDNLTSPYFPNLSRGGLATIAVLSLLFVLTSIHRLNHTDLWGHINFGRWIAEHRALPAADPLAAAPSATPILHAAWLSQLAAYEVQRLFGNEGLVFGHALLVTLIAGMLMLAVRSRGVPPLWACAAGALMFLLDLPIVGTIRPQLFGQLGAALFLLACAQMPRHKHPLVWIPLVAALWANLHGSIAMGLAILGIYAVGVTFAAWREASGKFTTFSRDGRLPVVWGAVLLALAGACLNPHGPLLIVRTLLFNEHAALASISEWRTLAPGSLTGILMIASLLATAALVKLSPRKWESYEILLLIVFGLATLPAIRMLAWWAVVWPWVALPHAAAAWRKYRGAAQRDLASAEDPPTAMQAVLAMGFVFMAILVAPPTYSLVAGHARGAGQILGQDTPLYVADEAIRRGLAGNFAAPLDWSDFLVFQTERKLKPLVHSHVHLCDAKTWKDHESLFRGDTLWLQVLQRHQMQYLLVPKQRCAALARQVLREDKSGAGRLRIIYQDQRCLLAELPPATAAP